MYFPLLLTAVAPCAAEPIPGFDQTKTDSDKTKVWTPFSDRKIRMGLVGYGVCQFSAAFEFQNHPNIEVVAASDLFPDRCAAVSTRHKPRLTATAFPLPAVWDT